MAARAVSRAEALAMAGVRHACHVGLYAEVAYSLWGSVPAGHAVLMQLRFDGLLGFPGGLVDTVDGALEDLAAAANRELREELSGLVAVGDGDYRACLHLPDAQLCTHFFAKRVSEATLDALERDALTAHDRFEVCGTLRVPCYGLEGGTGFGAFLQQGFAGNARQQLVELAAQERLVERPVLDAAVARARAQGLLAPS